MTTYRVPGLGQRIIPVVLALLLGTASIALVAVSKWMEAAGLVAAALLVFLIAFRRYDVWMAGSMMAMIYWFGDGDKDVSVVEVGAVAWLYGGGLLWLAESFVRRRVLIHTTADAFAALFFGLALLNSFVAAANGADMLLWLREYLALGFSLLYFPFRAEMTSKNLFRVLTVVAAMVSVGMCIKLAINFSSSASAAVYAFQILTSRDTGNEMVYTIGAVFFTVSFALARTPRHALAALALMIVNVGALVATFTRSFWLAYAVTILIMPFFLPLKRSIRLFAGTFATAAAGVAFLFVFMPNVANVALTLIGDRFLSTGKGKSDVSVQSRLAEYSSVWREVERSPFFGNGLGKKFRFMDPVTRTAPNTPYVHNVYLAVTYKFGVPMALLFVAWLVAVAVQLAGDVRATKNTRYYAYPLGALLSFLTILIANLGGSQLFMRPASAAMVWIIASSAVATRLARQDDQEQAGTGGRR